MPEEKNKSEVQPNDLASLWGDSSKEKAEEIPPSPEARGKITKEAEAVVEGEIVEKTQKSDERKKSQPESGQTSSPEEDMLLEEESFGDRLDSFLAELNLSRKHIFLGCSCLVLLIVFIFGGIWFFNSFLPNRPDKKPAKSEQGAIQREIFLEDRQTGIDTALSFGKPFFLPPSFFSGDDLLLTFLVGRGKGQQGQFGNYVFLLKRMQNAYSTDVNALLREATDRRAALENHIGRLKKLNGEGESAFRKIQNEVSSSQTSLGETIKKQEELQEAFFNQINVFNPQAEDFLSQFIEKAEHGVALKARTRAFEQLQKFYQQGLPRLAARIRDLELNEEALVSGIKVYDIRGSDLQLIILEEGAQDNTEKKAFPLINPSPGSMEDFITKPQR